MWAFGEGWENRTTRKVKTKREKTDWQDRNLRTGGKHQKKGMGDDLKKKVFKWNAGGEDDI